jgi:hypothetical protein
MYSPSQDRARSTVTRAESHPGCGSRQRSSEDVGQNRVDLGGEGAAEPRTLRFIPVTGVE